MIGSPSNLALQHTFTEHLGCSKHGWGPRNDWGPGSALRSHSLELPLRSAYNSPYLEYKGLWERWSLRQVVSQGRLPEGGRRHTELWRSLPLVNIHHGQRKHGKEMDSLLGEQAESSLCSYVTRSGVFSNCPRIKSIFSTLLFPSP